MKKGFILFLFFLVGLLHLEAADRYWIATVATNWNNTANWSTTDGGSGGASVPGASDDVFFTGSRDGDCNIDIAVTVNSLNIASGHTGTMDLNGNTVTVSGSTSNNFADGNIIDGMGTDSLVFITTGTATTGLTSLVADVIVRCSSAQLYLASCEFKKRSYFEKTGATDNDHFGGNKFVGDVTFANSGAGHLKTTTFVKDSCMADLNIINTGSGDIIIFDQLAGNYVGGDLNVTNSGTGAGTYYTKIGRASGGSAHLQIDGNVTITQDGDATDLNTYFGEDMDITVGGNLTVINQSTGTDGDIRIAEGTSCFIDITGNVSMTNSSASGTQTFTYLGDNGDIDVGGTLDLTNTSSATRSSLEVGRGSGCTINITGNVTATNSKLGGNWGFIDFGNNGDVTFDGTVAAVNSSTASANRIRFCLNAASSVVFNDNVTIQSTHTSSDGILFCPNGNGAVTLAAGKTLTILGGSANFIGGALDINNFTQTGATAQSLELGSTAGTFSIVDCSWGGDVDFRGPRIYTEGTTYSGTARLEKTGGTADDNNVGGNTFTGNATLVNSGSADFTFGNGVTDTYSAAVTLTNSGTASLHFAEAGAGHSVTGGLTITNSATGAGPTEVYVANNSTSTLACGTVLIQNSGTGDALTTYLGNDGDVTITGTLTSTNTGTGTLSEVRIANGAASVVTVSSSTSVSNSGAGTTKNSYLGYSGDMTFSGTCTVGSNGTATNTAIYLNDQAGSVNTYNENLIVSSDNASSDGILLGFNGGSGTLAATKIISTLFNDISGGQLYLRNFTQTGATDQTIASESTASYIQLYDCNFGGNVTFSAPRMIVRGTTFSGTASLTKNGASDDVSLGGNTFSDDVTFTVSGAGDFTTANTSANDFDGNAIYVQSGSGEIIPTLDVASTYAKNITVTSTDAVTFGGSASGRVVMDGSTAQSINITGGTPRPIFRDLQLNNGSDDVTLNTPIRITTELDLDAGHLITTSTNLITLEDNASVSSYSEASFVDGPLQKVGDDAFTFPCGKNDTALATVGISAPSNFTDTFTLEYFQESVDGAGYTRTSKDGSLNHVGSPEYWILNRGAGGSDVSVTLSWDDRSQGVTDLADLVVARWDGSQWKDHGTDGAPTGNTTAGTVTTAAAVTSFSPFALASTTTDNPLPIELLNFNAYVNRGVVDIEWSTATEINNDYFTIERSKDGEVWEDVIQIWGEGNSHQVVSYFEKDYKPYRGISYYRLKQTDYDGKFSYSNTVPVKVSGISGFSGILNLFPNPAKTGDEVQLQFDEGLTAKSLLVVLKDIKGKEFYSKIVLLMEENQLVALPVNDDLPAGIYIVTATSEDRIYNQKLVVK